MNELILNPENPQERAMLISERDFQLEQRQAQALASSKLIPAQFQGNLPDCMIALEMSRRMNTGALEIMQNIYVVHGRPSFSSTYLIARVNQSGVIKGRLKFVYNGEIGQDSRACHAEALDATTGELLQGTAITVAMARAQGWYSRNGSKWPDMTDQMLAYRAAAFWARIYAPDATLGFHTTDEREDMPKEVEINPRHADAQSANAALENAVKEKKIEPKKAPKGKPKTVEKSLSDADILANNGWLKVAIDRVADATTKAEINDLRKSVWDSNLTDAERAIFEKTAKMIESAL
jgi:hypothetical protein